MRKILGLVALGALAGCQSVGGAMPVEIGHNRFEVSYTGSESAGLAAAQAFCQNRGAGHAAIVRHAGSKVIFVCGHAAERAALGRSGGTCMPTASGAKVCGVFH